MGIFFPLKNHLHNVGVKFCPATLPEAKNPYHLKPARQKELDIRGVAGKASVYKIDTSPEVIMEGFNAAMELMFYLAADGYKVKTPLFTMRIKVPGGYDGTETSVPDDVIAQLCMRPSAEARKFIRENVVFLIDGSIDTGGKIAHVRDEATGLIDTTATRGNILTIRGNGLKIDAEIDKKDMAGVFFLPESGVPVKTEVMAVNQPSTIKVVVPASLTAGQRYGVAVETQTAARASNHLLKEMRDVRSPFTVLIQ